MKYVSHADLGGTDVAGPIVPEPEGEVFHAPWEAKTLALTLAMGGTGLWNIDMIRSVRETLPDYSRLSYYEIWFHGLCKMLGESGLVGSDELAAGHSLRPPFPIPRVLHAQDVPGTLARGSPTERRVERAPRFAVAERVRTLKHAPEYHTRLPGYARGRVGVIERLLGPHVFANAHAQGLGEAPQWLYTVVFEAGVLWGDAAPTKNSRVSIDAWESYLLPA
ncbi:MAG: nitrile hydratase subunit beta [Steroidobacterales bacterium]